ncbi:hypothetical protein DSM109990_01303 [Sulfitobacter dubius]|uniref:Uncharacterized protein n=1 Tax=Sulfitobacter dubius TaxID=218673 RepID=A0ABY3ZJX5_9RHOB|nr:hypothetical protein [Sulfitobacter dubius]UOA14497.1 hypothetical protein DSM109990_01303 [Sulfitobacter dubius]
MTPVISAGECVLHRGMYDTCRRKVSRCRIIFQVLRHDVDDLISQDAIGRAYTQPRSGVIGLIVRGFGCSALHVRHHGSDNKSLPSPKDVTDTKAADHFALAGALLMKLVSAAHVLSRSRSGQKRQYDRKFFHGIDYTRFLRFGQGGAS